MSNLNNKLSHMQFNNIETINIDETEKKITWKPINTMEIELDPRQTRPRKHLKKFNSTFTSTKFNNSLMHNIASLKHKFSKAKDLETDLISSVSIVLDKQDLFTSEVKLASKIDDIVEESQNNIIKTKFKRSSKIVKPSHLQKKYSGKKPITPMAKNSNELPIKSLENSDQKKISNQEINSVRNSKITLEEKTHLFAVNNESLEHLRMKTKSAFSNDNSNKNSTDYLNSAYVNDEKAKLARNRSIMKDKGSKVYANVSKSTINQIEHLPEIIINKESNRFQRRLDQKGTHQVMNQTQDLDNLLINCHHIETITSKMNQTMQELHKETNHRRKLMSKRFYQQITSDNLSSTLFNPNPSSKFQFNVNIQQEANFSPNTGSNAKVTTTVNRNIASITRPSSFLNQRSPVNNYGESSQASQQMKIDISRKNLGSWNMSKRELNKKRTDSLKKLERSGEVERERSGLGEGVNCQFQVDSNILNHFYHSQKKKVKKEIEIANNENLKSNHKDYQKIIIGSKHDSSKNLRKSLKFQDQNVNKDNWKLFLDKNRTGIFEHFGSNIGIVV